MSARKVSPPPPFFFFVLTSESLFVSFIGWTCLSTLWSEAKISGQLRLQKQLIVLAFISCSISQIHQAYRSGLFIRASHSHHLKAQQRITLPPSGHSGTQQNWSCSFCQWLDTSTCHGQQCNTTDSPVWCGTQTNGRFFFFISLTSHKTSRFNVAHFNRAASFDLRGEEVGIRGELESNQSSEVKTAITHVWKCAARLTRRRWNRLEKICLSAAPIKGKNMSLGASWRNWNCV